MTGSACGRQGASPAGTSVLDRLADLIIATGPGHRARRFAWNGQTYPSNFGDRLGGDWPRYFLWPRGETHAFPLRADLFGFANYTGLASTLILIGLLALSNDLALRRLGTTRWKSLQRWNYAGFALMAAHGVVYQVMGKRVWPVALAFAAVLVTVLAVQIAGWRVARR